MKRKIISFILILCMALSVNTICNASYKSVAETEFEGHTYCLYDESLSWTEAKKYCESIGGYLAVITSEEEQEIIEELLENGKKNQYWLGGTDNGHEGKWQWITLEDWEYTNWDNRQPDNGFGNEHYLQIYKKPNPRVPSSKSYKWNDITENNVFNNIEMDYFDTKFIGFICEMEEYGMSKGNASSESEKQTSFGSEVSIWAKETVEEAHSAGLIPDSLLGEELNEKITRAEFAAIAVNLYEKLCGDKGIEELENNPFKDIEKNVYKNEILKAYSLDITTGTTAKAFSPDSHITREQMAAMLTRTYKKAVLEGWTLEKDSEYPLDYSGVAPFADDIVISPYAKESVYFMAKRNIIQGVDNNCFAPKSTMGKDEAYGYATREQAIIIAQRTVKMVNEGE